MRKRLALCTVCLSLVTVASAVAQEKSQTVEEIVARVNNEVITRSDYQTAQTQFAAEVKQECPTCTTEQLDEKIASGKNDVLRDLIDRSLLVQRATDLGINVDTDVIKRLDDIRIQNNIPSMEELERQVNQTGQSFEDLKSNIKDQILMEEVIRHEVSPKIIVDHADVQKYYDDHKQEFVRPEQVILREIFVSTDGKSEAEIAALRRKADGLLDRVKNGEDFGELAKHFSDSPTAKQGGDLGTFERGKLLPSIEAIVFNMNRNDVTDVISTPKPPGFEILQVREHYPSGQQPEDKVDAEIMEKLFSDKMVQARRDYLDTLRQDSYVEVKPGYKDSAGVASSSIEEVPATPDDGDKKSKKKKNEE